MRNFLSVFDICYLLETEFLFCRTSQSPVFTKRILNLMSEFWQLRKDTGSELGQLCLYECVASLVSLLLHELVGSSLRKE